MLLDDVSCVARAFGTKNLILGSELLGVNEAGLWGGDGLLIRLRRTRFREEDVSMATVLEPRTKQTAVEATEPESGCSTERETLPVHGGTGSQDGRGRGI